MTHFTRKTLGALLLAAVAISANAASDALDTARSLASANKWSEVVSTLEEHLKFEVSEPAVDDLLGQALTKLGRKDEAAFYFDRALATLPENDKEAPKIRKRLLEVDPLTTKRDAATKKVVKSLLDSAKALKDGGHVERALGILERITPSARGAELAEIQSISGAIRASTERVNLDQEGAGDRPEDGWPVYNCESAHYLLEAKLESSVAEKLGKTMDEIFGYYVKIYFDGDESKVNPRKATIVIHSSHADLAKSWKQDDHPPLGWWSPGDWEVHAFDTRGDSGSLDAMLDTLFHEASHQFMTMLAGFGGNTPAWLNEGTASFFEGAVAMADGRVLWPDAATSRLQGLNWMLDGKSAGPDTPTFLDVISYDKPGSYPPPYYEWGWGLVYFLQQYEDPQTLQYVYRPLYIAYRDEIIKKSGDPRALFENVIVGSGSHTTLAAFETEWRRWIQKTVYPMHFGADRRELRIAAVQRYVEAARAAAAKPKDAKVSEQELLLRALGHIEYVRTKIDSADEPDPHLLLQQSDIFERLGRSASAAPLFEQLIEMAGDGRWEAKESELAAIEKRLSKLDSKNSALRTAHAREKSLGKTITELLGLYEAAKDPMLLRAYSLASAMALALNDEESLGATASTLRSQARDAGLLRGSIYRLDGGSWVTILDSAEKTFTHAEGRLEIECVRGAGRLCTSTPISGEYEIRARITQVGQPALGSHYGMIVSGTANGDWLIASVDYNGKLYLKRIVKGVSGTNEVNVALLNLREPPTPGQPFDFVAHVSPNGEIEVTVGEDGPYPFTAPLALPAVAYVGIYVKNGRLLVEDAVTEILP